MWSIGQVIQFFESKFVVKKEPDKKVIDIFSEMVGKATATDLRDAYLFLFYPAEVLGGSALFEPNDISGSIIADIINIEERLVNDYILMSAEKYLNSFNEADESQKALANDVVNTLHQINFIQIDLVYPKYSPVDFKNWIEDQAVMSKIFQQQSKFHRFKPEALTALAFSMYLSGVIKPKK